MAKKVKISKNPNWKLMLVVGLVFGLVGGMLLPNTFAARSSNTSGTISIIPDSTDGKIRWGTPVSVNWSMQKLPKSKYVYIVINCPENVPTDPTSTQGGADWTAVYYPGTEPSPWETVIGRDHTYSRPINNQGTAEYYNYYNYSPEEVARKTDQCSVNLLVGGSGPSTLVSKKLFEVIP